MAQHKLINVLNCLLNRGTTQSTETLFFKDVKHDELVNTLSSYLNAHRRFLSLCHIENSQALNDKGVDLILKADSSKIGFQIKSHFDVTKKNFNLKVKAQFADALAYGLDHYYVMFCCPIIKDGSVNFGMKMTHLRNELELFQKINFTVYGPQVTAALFANPPTVTRNELLLNGAISDDALHDHELGYEHLPDILDKELLKTKEILDVFGDDWFDSDKGQSAFDAYWDLQHRKQAKQFMEQYFPTFPIHIRDQRTSLIRDIEGLLLACRNCKLWDDRSEYKLNSWIEHVPENMIPFTSLPNLLKIQESLQRFLKINQQNEMQETST